MKAARVFQLTTLALLVVSAVQVGYWVFDQRSYTIEKVHAARAAYAEQAGFEYTPQSRVAVDDAAPEEAREEEG